MRRRGPVIVLRARGAGACVALGLLFTLLGLIAPASGRAAVTSSATTISVSGPGAAVTVTRDPFRMSFTSSGSTGPVLSEVAGSDALLPNVLAPTEDPVAPGTEPAQSGELYEPLSFLVGTEAITEYDGLVWGGDLMTGVRSGLQYAAERVVAVAADGAGAQLTVATDDPTGRQLIVTLAPDGRGRIAVSVVPDPATGVALMTDAFASPAGEAFYGFGGRHNALDQTGQDLASWTSEENITGIDSSVAGPAAELFPNGPTAAYYPQAQFVSSRGYGFLLNEPQLAWFRMDSDQSGAWSVAADAPSLSYVVAPAGQVQPATASLTAITGRQPAPPRWALGPMMDRLVKNVGETEADYEGDLTADLANLVRYRIPITAYRIEGWGFNGPDGSNDGLSLHTYVSPSVQASVIRTLRRRGIHPLAYLRPWIVPGSAPDEAGYTVRNAAGGTYLTSSTTGTPVALLDFTNPAAVRWWAGEIDKMLDLGFDGFMSDFGEEVTDDMHFADGETGASMHNRYLVLYMQADREAVEAYMRTHPGRRIWFFNRAGYSGTPGSAAYEGGNFPGDETTSWDGYAGLASLAPDMLSRAIGGAFGYGTDIGGYYDFTTPPTTKELFLRWAEWAALSPVFRLHGSGLAGTHTPWSYDAQTVAAYRWLSQLHLAAGGLILTLWRQGDRTGLPPTRPLWLQFPRVSGLSGVTEEWMVGPEVLVAPVVTQGDTSVSVTFPPGCWREPQTRMLVRGSSVTVRSVNAPLTSLPFFFRCGTRPFRLPR